MTEKPTTESLCEEAVDLARPLSATPSSVFREKATPLLLALVARARELEAENDEAHQLVDNHEEALAQKTDENERLQAERDGWRESADREATIARQRGEDGAALRARLAETEAALVGLRDAACKVKRESEVGTTHFRYDLHLALNSLDAALADSTPIGARIIAEAVERGRLQGRAELDDEIEAAIGKRDEARTKLAAVEAYASGMDDDLQEIAAERDAARAELTTLTARAEAAETERDQWVRSAQRIDAECTTMSNADAAALKARVEAAERGYALLDEELQEIAAERDAALAQLAEVREAGERLLDAMDERDDLNTKSAAWMGLTRDDLRAALSASPSAALARVRAAALRAAADEADKGSERGGWQDGPLSGDVLPNEVADWLRTEAERIEREAGRGA